ncbi:Rossmann-like domain-containing protein [uncultured Flavonifractor sp.]|uniref:Rossmann-like domain-containing protein n=1 Tax=uncultured Flavonifractor sp. TaxID=1193534 RepID=UPI002606AEDC|nr:DUF364 domain-containing protein [uncultured Flavonifractor sp.]
MTTAQLYATLRTALAAALAEGGLTGEAVTVSARGLTPEEAIGRPGRTDYPILSGREVMLMADFQGARGQAFTDAPVAFQGRLAEVLDLDLEGDDHSRGLFIAVLNAVMARLGRADNTVHCKDGGPEFCARHMADWVAETYGAPRIALVGFQPALIGALGQRFPLKVLDLNPDNIGKVKDGCPVLDGRRDRQAVLDWAELVLCTGSTLCNGTLVDYLGLEKEVVFFGTTLSGAAPILGLKRMCFADESRRAE